MMIIFRPFGVEDYIEAGGAEASVQEIQLFNTIILTKDQKRIIVPNSKITDDKNNSLSTLVWQGPSDKNKMK